MKRRKIYKIAGYIIESFINPQFLRSNFEDYEIIYDGIADVVINVILNSDLEIQSVVKDLDEYKNFFSKGQTYSYIYKRNRYVVGCEIQIVNCGTSIINIFVNNNSCDLEIVKREITYSFMDTFYTFLTEQGTFCLHSCGFTVNNKGILISGDPGSGKSTIVKELSKCFMLKYVGEDINACKDEGKFYGMPWCRINNNTFSNINAVIFLGDKTDEIEKDIIYDLLIKSEFSMNWLPGCIETVNRLSNTLYKESKCFMLNNHKNNTSVEKIKTLVKEIAYEQ